MMSCLTSDLGFLRKAGYDFCAKSDYSASVCVMSFALGMEVDTGLRD
ncbi:MAG TPA: hypothetical protein VF273_07860 [Pelobium sp.]